MDKGLTEERIAEIPNYEFSEVLSRREKLALKLAEKMGIEHAAIDDGFCGPATKRIFRGRNCRTLDCHQHLHRMGTAAIGVQSRGVGGLTRSGWIPTLALNDGF